MATPRRAKDDQEQQAFDQSNQFATRPGDQAWKAQLVASLERASTGRGSFQRWEQEIIRALRNATGVREVSERLVFDANPPKDERKKLLDRLIWLTEVAEQYGGLHVITGRELEFKTSVINTASLDSWQWLGMER